MNGFFRRKQEPEPLLLYQQYKREVKEKEEKKKEEKEPAVLLDASTILNDRKKEIRKIPRTLPLPYPEKKKVILPYSIAVCSLSKGCGSTHMTAMLAHYMKQQKTSVLVQTKQETGENKSMLKEYEHLLSDFGNIFELDSSAWGQLLLCEKKIMMCLASEDYFVKLAAFIEKRIDSTQSWSFFFNFVTERWKKKVEDLMEDYTTIFVPMLDVEDANGMEALVRKVW